MNQFEQCVQIFPFLLPHATAKGWQKKLAASLRSNSSRVPSDMIVYSPKHYSTALKLRWDKWFDTKLTDVEVQASVDMVRAIAKKFKPCVSFSLVRAQLCAWCTSRRFRNL